MLTQTVVRTVLSKHMETAGVARHALAERTKLPMSTLYQVFNTKRDVRISFDNVALILSGLGLTFAWLEDQVAKLAPKPKAKPAAAVKAKAKPARKHTVLKYRTKRK